MEQAITRQSFYEYDISNGTKDTMFALTDAKNSFDAFDRMRTLPIYNEYIANCIDYYETENAIFVHGWIPCDKYRKGFYPIIYHYDYWKDWRNAQKYEWEDARWLNGMECWDNGVREPHKTIFCGHWHTEWAREVIDKICAFHTSRPEDFKPWVRDGIVALDACTAYTHFVNCYVWEE